MSLQQSVECSFPDNLVLKLERDKTSIRVYTTDLIDSYKIVRGMSFMDGIINIERMNIRQVKQLMIDSVINGYELTLNQLFREGFFGIAKQLALEREETLKREEEERKLKIGDIVENPNEIVAEIYSDTSDEIVRETTPQTP